MATVDQSTKLDLIISGMRATQWGKAKGELHALVATVGGTTPIRAVGSEYLAKWEVLQQRVEDFIKDIENDGLHE